MSLTPGRRLCLDSRPVGKEPLTTSLAALISLRRKQDDLTQGDLAERVGVDQRTVSTWERGLGFPASVHWDTLAEVLATSRSNIAELVKRGQVDAGVRVTGDERDVARLIAMLEAGEESLRVLRREVAALTERLDRLEDGARPPSGRSRRAKR